MVFGGRHKDKGFSSSNKIQQYHSDGTETIILMGRPFRVLKKIGTVDIPLSLGQRSTKHTESTNSFLYLVENSSLIPELPAYLMLKRAFFSIHQVAEAHREIEIFSQVKDKNIMRIFHSEISRSEGKLSISIAMEYCRGNLWESIQQRKSNGSVLTEGDICHVLIAMTSALGYLHSLQPPIAHRALCMENIFIDNKQVGPLSYKLSNFAHATTEAYHCANSEEATMAIADIELHTHPGFRAPEMADPWSKRRISEKADMWSLGVLTYYMMYNTLPFEATNMVLSANPKVRFPVSAYGGYTGSLRVVVEHLLDPNPDTRWDVFALTNFLRFDEDASRHLGTFCFTRTEYPEGWEEQDVKVLNRQVPPKAPPVTYHEDGHATAEDQRRAQAEEPGQMTRSDATASMLPVATINKHRAVSADDEEALRAAIMVLGEGTDLDPEVAQYREQIIREQMEAWEMAKTAAGCAQEGPGPSADKDSAALASSASCAVPSASSKNLFDDLFAAPAQASAPLQPPPQEQPPFMALGDWGTGAPAAMAMMPDQRGQVAQNTQPLQDNTGNFAFGLASQPFPMGASPGNIPLGGMFGSNVGAGNPYFSATDYTTAPGGQTYGLMPMSQGNPASMAPPLSAPLAQEQNLAQLLPTPPYSNATKNSSLPTHTKDPFAELFS